MAVATTLELFSLAKPADATEVNFIALTSDNSIARYNSNSGKFKKAIEVKGVDGNLQGIDFVQLMDCSTVSPTLTRFTLLTLKLVLLVS